MSASESEFGFLTPERRRELEFARRSAEGMNRAAREGRYCGGIVALGHRIAGRKQTAHLVPDETEIWQGLSAADLVRDIYERLVSGGQSGPAIAAGFNAAGIPTHYTRDCRGVRGKKTQGLWRHGHIGNLVRNPIYRGVLSYGRRSSKRDREVIAASVEPLVSAALWDLAQAALARNRVCPRNAGRVYLMRGVMRCGICGLTYVGSAGKGVAWYRCGGQLVERGPLAGRCPNRSVRSDMVETLVWSDIERYLRDPEELLDELDARGESGASGAVPEAEPITLARALTSIDAQRAKTLDLAVRGHPADHLLEATLDRIAAERDQLVARLDALAATECDATTQAAIDALTRARERLDEGLSEQERAELVQLLVRVTVNTEITEDGHKSLSLAITYRFPRPGMTGTVSTRTRTDSYVNYTTVRRVIELPVGRHPSPPRVDALVAGAS
jgi:site-specific DNA recombinase